MQFFVIITLQANGRVMTIDAIVDAPGGVTRQDIYQYVRQLAAQRCGNAYAQANVVFFHAEPNNLSGAESVLTQT